MSNFYVFKCRGREFRLVLASARTSLSWMAPNPALARICRRSLNFFANAILAKKLSHCHPFASLSLNIYKYFAGLNRQNIYCAAGGNRTLTSGE
jgi:hypothetical protein